MWFKRSTCGYALVAVDGNSQMLKSCQLVTSKCAVRRCCMPSTRQVHWTMHCQVAITASTRAASLHLLLHVLICRTHLAALATPTQPFSTYSSLLHRSLEVPPALSASQIKDKTGCEWRP
jgi:hypothetical protein